MRNLLYNIAQCIASAKWEIETEYNIEHGQRELTRYGKLLTDTDCADYVTYFDSRKGCAICVVFYFDESEHTIEHVTAKMYDSYL